MDYTTVDNAVLAGFLQAFGVKVTPARDQTTGRVIFNLSGDVEAGLPQVYDNRPIPSLTALQAIKSCRQAIFTLKGRGGSR